MRFGASKEEEDSHGSLHPIIDSFRAGCSGQDLLFCKEAWEKPIGQSAKKNKKMHYFHFPSNLNQKRYEILTFPFFWSSFFICF